MHNNNKLVSVFVVMSYAISPDDPRIVEKMRCGIASDVWEYLIASVSDEIVKNINYKSGHSEVNISKIKSYFKKNYATLPENWTDPVLTEFTKQGWNAEMGDKCLHFMRPNETK